MTTSMPLLLTLTCTSRPATSSCGFPQAPCENLPSPTHDISVGTAKECNKGKNVLIWEFVPLLQEPLNTLEADRSLLEGSHRHLRRRNHYRCSINALTLSALLPLFTCSLDINGCKICRLDSLLRFSGFTGSLSCAPNQSNPRDLDLSLNYSFKGKNGSCSASQTYRMR